MMVLKAKFTGDLFDADTYFFPYLGQLAFNGILDGMTWACRVPPIKSFCPASFIASGLECPSFGGDLKEQLETAMREGCWFQPEAAEKTIESLYRLMLLRSPVGYHKYFADIHEEVAYECRDLCFLLEEADAWDFQFRFEFEELNESPEQLTRWSNLFLDRTSRAVRSALESAGVVARRKEEDGDE